MSSPNPTSNEKSDSKPLKKKVSMETNVFLTSKLIVPRKSIHQYRNLNDYNSHLEKDLNLQLQIKNQFQKKKRKKIKQQITSKKNIR